MAISNFLIATSRNQTSSAGARQSGLQPDQSSVDGPLELWNDPSKNDKFLNTSNSRYDVTATAGDVGKLLRIFCLKDDGFGSWDEFIINIALIDGTVTTNVGDEGIRLQRAALIPGGVAGDNVGIITINNNGSGELQGHIDIGEGITQMSHFTAPSSSLARGPSSGTRIVSGSVSISRTSAGGFGDKSGEATFYIRQQGGARLLLFAFGLSTAGTSAVREVDKILDLLQPKTDLWLVSSTESSNVRFSFSMELLIEGIL